ncbi:hypothetical protein [Kitasatospora sp. MBT63]|uniref:hypothetical protein n=1 Tax=Kitasatospora sp. MBT63 TaxID=1444768 RepID=UPI00068D7B2C|nr:hypothetical protein [Kitasatospora sp. MBT63]
MAPRLLRTAARLALALGALAATAVPAAAAPAAAPWTAALDGCPGTGPLRPCLALGTPQRLGDGLVRTYARLDHGRPLSVGILYSDRALDHLPTAMTDGHHCFDVDGDGRTDPMTECAGSHERVLPLPAALLRMPDMPLKWALVNWNPMGHPPAAVFDRPHFDNHFYLQPKAERDAIRPGPCRGLTNCADYATATRPVPAEYLPADHQNKNITEVAMGNHLPDLTSPEWHGAPFTKTFVYGSYDARITFLEPMVTLATLRDARTSDPATACSPVKQPKAWQQPGWYPRSYCVGYRPDRHAYSVSLEDFALHR